jgi:flagellar hook-length control protein FliK
LVELAGDASTELSTDAKAKKSKTRDTPEIGAEALVGLQKNAAEANPAVAGENTIANAAAFSPDTFAHASDAAPDGAGKKVAGLEHTPIRVVDERGEKSVTMDVNLGAAGIGSTVNGSAGANATGGTEAASSSSFDRLLQAELQKNAGELVKAGQIVLQNNDVGTIRLVLHPEALGNVKINLRLNDGRVTGSIACGSEEAYRVLKETIPSLEQAFKQGGFETNGFDLTWGRGNSDTSGQNAQGHAENAPHAQDFALASGEYVHGLPDALTVGESAPNRAVNLVA